MSGAPCPRRPLRCRRIQRLWAGRPGGAPLCDRSRKGEPMTARRSSRWLGTRAVAHVLLVSCSSLVWEGLVTRERVPRRAHRHFWGDGRSCPDGGRFA